MSIQQYITIIILCTTIWELALANLRNDFGTFDVKLYQFSKTTIPLTLILNIIHSITCSKSAAQRLLFVIYIKHGTAVGNTVKIHPIIILCSLKISICHARNIRFNDFGMIKRISWKRND